MWRTDRFRGEEAKEKTIAVFAANRSLQQTKSSVRFQMIIVLKSTRTPSSSQKSLNHPPPSPNPNPNSSSSSPSSSVASHQSSWTCDKWPWSPLASICHVGVAWDSQNLTSGNFFSAPRFKGPYKTLENLDDTLICYSGGKLQVTTHNFWPHSITASPHSAQYVILHSKIVWRKVEKMCRFGSENSLRSI